MSLLAHRCGAPYRLAMQRAVQLDDGEYAGAIDREIGHLRESGVLGRSSKLRDLFEYLVERSRMGPPPREVEIAQDVFGRTGPTGDDGAARVYIHRLRKRLEEIYRERPDAEVRITCPLGEYRLVADIGPVERVAGDGAIPVAVYNRWPWRAIAAGAVAGVLLAALLVLTFAPRPTPGWRAADEIRRSGVWAPLFANGRNILVAQGDHYLFAQKGAGGEPARLVRDFRIHSSEELNAHLLRHAPDAGRYADAGLAYVPVTVPRAQLYLSRVLLAAENVRVLPASQVPAAAMLSQNIVYLGLTSGLGPLRATVAAGSRFELGRDADLIRDKRTDRVYRGGQPQGDTGAPRRQYGVLSLFAGKEGNRYLVLAGTSEMGLVGLAETLADPARLHELTEATGGSGTAEALYQIDSQGGGVLAVRLIATNIRDERRIWQP